VVNLKSTKNITILPDGRMDAAKCCGLSGAVDKDAGNAAMARQRAAFRETRANFLLSGGLRRLGCERGAQAVTQSAVSASRDLR